MARGNNPGRDFDDQFNSSKRRAAPKVAKGEGHWADDKKIRDLNSGGGGVPSGGGCMIAMITLIALAVALLTGCGPESDMAKCDREFKKYLVAAIQAENAQEAQALNNTKTPAACQRLSDDERDRILVNNAEMLGMVRAHEAELSSQFTG